MEAPLCKTCGKHHWERICPSLLSSHVSVDGKQKPRSSGQPKTSSGAPLSGGTPKSKNAKGADTTTASASVSKKRAPNGTFDRKAYQRELMRKRRAAAKAALKNS